jgi:putative acetyltransferase
MPETEREIVLAPMQPHQAEETRRMIYRVAHAMFHESGTLEETMAHYRESWPLDDLTHFPGAYAPREGGAFLVMTDAGRVIGSGGIRRIDETACELKRFWFLPEYQGQGHAYRLFAALVEIARRSGYRFMRLETSPQYQPRAYAFYLRQGFYDIPRYGDDLDDVGMEMAL